MLSKEAGKKEDQVQDVQAAEDTEIIVEENDKDSLMSAGLIENNHDDDHGWGLVHLVDSTEIATSVLKQQEELDQTGVLILSGDEEKTTEKERSSSDDASTLGNETPALNNETTSAAPAVLPADGVPTEIPHEHDIPSDLETLPDIPMDDNRSHAPSEGINALKEELDMADVLFGLRAADNSKEKKDSASNTDNTGSNNKFLQVLQQPHFMVLVFGCLLVVSVFCVYERSMWLASMKELRTELESQRQLEAHRQMEIANLKEERQMEISSLKKEFQQALKDQEKLKPTTRMAVEDDEPNQGTARPSPKMKRQRPGDFKFPNFLFDESTMDETGYQFENCWIEAETRLGDCAKQAKNAFKARLQTMGRSLWHVQEHVVDKANDLGKLVKRSAERVVSEAERWSQNSSTSSTSTSSFSNQSASKGKESNQTAMQESKTNFRSMATTLVSSVALASLAAVVADKASSYIAGLGEERE